MPGYVRVRAWVYLNKLYEHRGFKRSFDSVALHPYAGTKHAIRLQLKRMRRVMRRHHDARSHLWITELGWGSKRPDQTTPINKGLRGQKRMLKRTFPYLQHHHRRWRLSHVFWFRWRDPAPGTPGCKFCSSSGLFRHSQKPKPVWRAFKRVTAARR
jgi:hypothetical protein